MWGLEKGADLVLFLGGGAAHKSVMQRCLFWMQRRDTLSSDILDLCLLLFEGGVAVFTFTKFGRQKTTGFSLYDPSVNFSKTKVVVSRKGCVLRYFEKKTIDRESLKVVSCYKYLGMAFSS